MPRDIALMPYNTPYRLPQTPGPPMLMVRLGSPVLMENNTLPLLPHDRRIQDPMLPDALHHILQTLSLIPSSHRTVKSVPAPNPSFSSHSPFNMIVGVGL